MPHIDFLKEPKKLITFVPPEHFAAIYQACPAANLPKLSNIDPADQHDLPARRGR